MAWNPPRVGSEEREKMPRSAFLDPEGRRYPFKVKRNGEWVESEEGLMAAYRRAIIQGETDIRDKALARLNRIRRKKGKEELPLED